MHFWLGLTSSDSLQWRVMGYLQPFSFTTHLHLAEKFRSSVLKQPTRGHTVHWWCHGYKTRKWNYLLVLYFFCLLFISWKREDGVRSKKNNQGSFFAKMPWEIFKPEGVCRCTVAIPWSSSQRNQLFRVALDMCPRWFGLKDGMLFPLLNIVEFDLDKARWGGHCVCQL